MKLIATTTAAIAAIFVFAAPTFAENLSPVGKWQTVSGESRYEVRQCGDGHLCAKLTWLRSDARTKENLKYLNKTVLRGAKQTSPNRWKGAVHYGDDVFGGSMVLVSPEKLKLSGCMGIFCQTLNFRRL